ncbi:MAG: hypothetical protein EZS28_014604 [Streblomastix strix]|uniref:B30.2/SPRY domain-containing protein n=1 Tax=Streblomastix strix TaxID=222440 RepID=A0A5J4W553_9EUKA|nr:MAG: hypothetical protein EZS28_014604 [Streblomastix strix]
MDCASDYNVDGSLLGLGENILFEILFEMELLQDAQQFLVVCKKIYQLILHPRFARIIQSVKGIIRIEIIFENTGRYIRSMGIADTSCVFAAGSGPSEDGNDKKTVRYWGYGGYLDHITHWTIGNRIYEDGQRISAIVDMTSNPRKVVFYVDDIEQPNFVIGIPSEIRFWVRVHIQQIFFLHCDKI